MRKNNKKTAATMAYYLNKFKAPLILSLLPLLIVCGVQASASLITAEVFQRVIETDIDGLALWMLILAGAWFLIMVFSALEGLLQGWSIRKLNNAVRADMTATLSVMDYSHYHSADTGEYLSRFTNDVNQIENMAWKPFFQFAQAAAMAVFSVIALLTIHWSLLLAALVTTLVMVFVPQLFNKKMEQLGDTCTKEQAEATGIFKDLLSGWDVLKSFGQNKRFIDGFHSASEQIERPRFRLAYTKGCVEAGVGCVNVLCQLLITGLVGLLAIWGYTQTGSLVAGGNLCGMLSNSLGSMAGLFLSFSSSKPYFEKITVRAEDLQIRNDIEMEKINSEISVENLSFRYGEKSIFQNLSLQFKKGGKYALTGPSGCGKSTLLKLLLGWLTEYSGAIRFDDKDAKGFTPEQLQQHMGYIEQNVFLFNSTIKDNITLGETFTNEQIEKALHDSALIGDLSSMHDGIETVVGEDGANLSGGQKQRVAIARALIHNRSILLVDEGTSALDKENADIVEKSLLANPELTLILVSHHLTPERKEQFTHVYELQGTLAPAN